MKWICTRQARKACKHVSSRRDLLSFNMVKNASRLLFGFSARGATNSVFVDNFISFFFAKFILIALKLMLLYVNQCTAVKL